MFIKKVTSMHRRDYDADLECEHCGHEQHQGGMYADSYYDEHVLPAIKCKACGKASATPVGEQ